MKAHLYFQQSFPMNLNAKLTEIVHLRCLASANFVRIFVRPRTLARGPLFVQ